MTPLHSSRALHQSRHLSLSLCLFVFSRTQREQSRCCSILLSSTKDFDDDTRDGIMKRRNIGVVFSMIVLCLSLVAVTMMMETTTRRTRSTMRRAPSEKEEEEKEEEEASTRLVRATTAEEEDFVGERRLGKEDDDEEEEDEEEEDEDDAVSSTPPLTGGPDAMPWFPEDMETRTRDITEEMRRALVDENGWRRPKMYTRREDTDALKMFDGFEKEIERFKGNAETWRKVHAVGGADSFGVVYMATGNTRFIDRAAMVASRLKAHSKSKLSKRVRFCLYTDRSLYESWMRKLVETKEKVAKEGWNAVGVTDGGGWISPINSRKKYMLGNPFDEVVFYEGLADVLVDEKSMKQVEKSVAKRKSSGGGRASNTNLPLMFFLKKIVSLAGAPYARTIFADGDTCSCGDYAGEMFEELEGRFPSEREIEKGEGSSRGSGSRSIANIRQRRNESSAEMVPENGYDFMHIVDPARNQGGNHLGYDLREFYETEITYREAKFRRVNKTFEERNVGFIVYRPNKLTTTIFRQFAELLLGAINHNAFVRNEQPAYTEALWMWKDAIHERILNNQNDVCRKLSKHEKEYCQKPPFKPHKLARRGPLCRRGCRFAHEKCECWKNRYLNSQFKGTGSSDGSVKWANETVH